MLNVWILVYWLNGNPYSLELYKVQDECTTRASQMSQATLWAECKEIQITVPDRNADGGLVSNAQPLAQ